MAQAKYAVLGPGIIHYDQSDPFHIQSQTIDHFCASATPYILGATTCTFHAQYGYVTGATFNFVFGKDYTFDSTILDSWGTNDEYILNAIASVETLTVASFTNLEFTPTPFAHRLQ